MRRKKLLPITATGIVLTFGLTACSGSDDPAPEEPELSDYWTSRFDEALADEELPDVDRAALEDYWVSDDEWAAASDRFYECAEESAIIGYVAPSGEAYFAGLTEEDKERIRELTSNVDADLSVQMLFARNCALETVANIGFLYSGPRDNPEGLNRHESLRQCLVDHGHFDIAAVEDDEIDEYYLAGHMRFERGSYEECVESAAAVG